MNYKDFIKPNKITIFTKTGCKYCNFVKETFKDLKIKEINEINVSSMDDETYNLLMDDLVKDTNHNTFPFVFIDKVFCGGNSDIQHIKILGTLYELLKKYNIDFNVDCKNIIKYEFLSNNKNYTKFYGYWATVQLN